MTSLPPRHRPTEYHAPGEWPLATVLVCLFAGIGVLFAGHWRRGSLIIGIAVLVGGILRAVLPSRLAGLLVVRGRTADALVMLIVGAAIVALAFAVPAFQPVG